MNGIVVFVVGALVGGALGWRWASAKLRDANRSTIADLRALVGSRDSTISGLRAVVAARDDHVTQLRTELEAAQQGRAAADRGLAEQEQERVRMQSELEKAQQTCARVREQIMDLDRRLPLMQAELDAAQQARTSADQQLTDREREVADLRSELQHAQEVCAAADQQLAGRDQMLDRLQADLEGARQACARAESELDTAKGQQASVEGRIAENTRCIEQANQRLVDFVHQIADEIGRTCTGIRRAADTQVSSNPPEPIEPLSNGFTVVESAPPSAALEPALPSLARGSNGQHVTQPGE
jgi:chromosome segregation ATPase